MSQFRPTSFTFLPEVVKNLLILNVLLYLAKIILASRGIDLDQYLALHIYQAPDFRWWQYLSHMFMHGSNMHIFFNMFLLWMFGATLELTWGSKRFLIFYLVCGLGAAILHSGVQQIENRGNIQLIDKYFEHPSNENLLNFTSKHRFYIDENDFNYQPYLKFKKDFYALQKDKDNRELQLSTTKFMQDYRSDWLNAYTTVGASGAVFGLLLALGLLFPNSIIYFPFPIKIKYYVIAYVFLELYLGFQNNPGDNVAHFAHLGGMLFGYLLIRFWQNKREI